MKGNLSKKKGLLGEITTENLDYIANHLNTEYGKEITSLKNRTENSEEMIERHSEWIYDLDLRTEETEKKVTAIDAKEDKSNKIHSINTQSPSKEKYPSEYAVAEAIKNVKPDVDLSDYLTKEQTEKQIASVVANLEEKIEFDLGQMRTSIDNQLADLDGKDAELQQNIYDLQAASRSLDDRVEYLFKEVGDIESLLGGI